MKAKINENPSNRVEPNVVRMSRHFFELIHSQTDKYQWESLFSEFRLNLQSRMAGLDERDLLKLQAKQEYTMELEKFFLDIISGPIKDQ